MQCPAVPGYLTISRVILTVAGDGDAELCGTRIPDVFPSHPYRGQEQAAEKTDT